jgi:hypothetical protein
MNLVVLSLAKDCCSFFKLRKRVALPMRTTYLDHAGIVEVDQAMFAYFTNCLPDAILV